MCDTFTSEKIKNIESPFTELLSLLKRYESLPNGLQMYAYDADELRVIHQHIENAIEVLLQGLQDMGNLIGIAAQDNKIIIAELNNVGFFISAIGNLSEALNTLRSDADYELRQRGIINY